MAGSPMFENLQADITLCTVFICAALKPRYVFRMFEPALVEYALPGGQSSRSLKCVNNSVGHKSDNPITDNYRSSLFYRYQTS